MKTNFIIFMLLPIIALSAQTESFSLHENGTVPVWLVAGPFPNANPGVHGDKCFGYFKDYLTAMGGEEQAVPEEGKIVTSDDHPKITWQTAFSSPEGILDYIDILKVDKETPGVAYAFCQLIVPNQREAILKIRSNDGVRVWLNHQMVHDHHVGRTIESQEDRVMVNLKAGENRLLIKVDQGGGSWGLGFKVHNLHGKAFNDLLAAVSVKNLLKGKIESAKIKGTALIKKTEQGDKQILEGEILSGGLSDLTCRITKEDWESPQIIHFKELSPGRTSFQLAVPIIQNTGPAQISLQSESDRVDIPQLILHKPPHWVVYLVQHVHTDIGYTRPQTEILPEHLRFIDYALDYCDLTDNYPDDAKFRWTCEVSWPVREYLKRRPQEQIERFRRRVVEGRIEIDAMFLNMSEIATEDALAASLQPIREIRSFGLPVLTAMQNDVNGIGWCLVDYFSEIGVKYLTMGINKTRSVLPFDRPTAFWWESPSGKRLLAFRADHYHVANYWQLHNANLEFFRPRFLEYLSSLREKGYPFERIVVQYSGYHTDNSPPSSKASDLVKAWNELYTWPKLRIATASEFMQYVEKNHGAQLPVYRDAWPDWWTDGFGSAARETAEARRIHNAIQSSQNLLSMASLMGQKIPHETCQRITEVQEDLLFYDEHTFGAAESISDPTSENSMVQWGEKSSYVWEAVKKEGMLREEALGYLQEFIPRNKVPTLVVFNTLNWQRSGLVEVFIDHEILPADGVPRIISAESGEMMPARALRSRSEGTYWAIWAEDIPALGYKTFLIKADGVNQKPIPKSQVNPNLLENSFYRLQLDPDTGALISLFEKEMQQELVDGDCPWNLGQFVYELSQEERDLNNEKFERSSLKNISLSTQSETPIWKSFNITADVQGCVNPSGVAVEIRLYELEKKIAFHYRIRKERVAEAEACYAVFPFNLPQADILYEAQGGFVTPGKTQLPGSASDWQTIQNFITIRNYTGQLIFSSTEIPMVQFGDFNLGKWQYVADIKKPYIFSWVMNNYWFTNFRAFQEGEFEWSYYLTSSRDLSNKKAVHFGYNNSRPLIARILPPGSGGAQPSFLSALNLDAANVMMVSAKPAEQENSIIFHLREIEGNTALLTLKQGFSNNRVKSVDIVNVLQENLNTAVSEIPFEPYEVKFVKVNLNQ